MSTQLLWAVLTSAASVVYKNTGFEIEKYHFEERMVYDKMQS